MRTIANSSAWVERYPHPSVVGHRRDTKKDRYVFVNTVDTDDSDRHHGASSDS
jgi:hypothetical protein